MVGTYAIFEARGYPREDLLGFVVENLRRFKPLVAVGHDIKGEYGHGMHMVYTDLLMEAITITNDASFYPESAEKYGLWDTPKTYLHLYEENAIVMDWDQPLERFDGMTAFEVSVNRGFQMHITQISYFQWYYKGFPDAKSLPVHNPCYFGLYRSTVGPDVEKNDFFENVNTYGQDRQAELDRLSQEARQEEEAKQKSEEEAKRKAEEQARLDAQARAEKEQLDEAREALARTEKKRDTAMIILAVIAAGYLLLGYHLKDRKTR
jgi:hypothetical protein